VNTSKLYRSTLWVQGIYTTLTALWGLIDIDSFMAVTGPKRDIWLVKTVSAILLAIGLSFIMQAFIRSNALPVIVLALISSMGLAFIDSYYAINKVISKIYLGDAVLQILFCFVWIYVLIYFKELDRTDV
jgi:hypothetical protein